MAIIRHEFEVNQKIQIEYIERIFQSKNLFLVNIFTKKGYIW